MSKIAYKKPFVSILCLVYNHEKYVRKALEGFVQQKVNFPFEVIIHDDASTDRSAEIIREYELRYPEIIKPIYQQVNQHSLERGRVTRIVHDAATGKYIGLCEGDDYWTDLHKLQKQVDFLENHPDYSLCVGGYVKHEVGTEKEQEIIRRIPNVESNKDGFTFTLDDTKKGWLTKTLTAIYRNNKLALDQVPKYRYGRDINLFYHLLKDGSKGYYFKEIMGVYHVHEGGINSMKKGKVNTNEAYKVYKELYEVNRDEFSRHKYIRSTLSLLNYDLFHSYPENNLRKRLRLLREALSVIRSAKEVQFLFSTFVPETIKSRYRSKKALPERAKLYSSQESKAL